MRVGVIGTGHVGLVTAATRASLGHDVATVDADAEKIDMLCRGEPPFFEPGLPELVNEQGRRRAALVRPQSKGVLPGAEGGMICVGTPANPNGETNLAAVKRAALDIARDADDGAVVVGKSSVPAGTAESHPLDVRARPSRREVPPRVQPRVPPRGGRRSRFPRARPTPGRGGRERGVRLIETDVATAELSKHASNAFLALKISYANALARICEFVGADVDAVTHVMGSDPRIGPAFLGRWSRLGGLLLPEGRRRVRTPRRASRLPVPDARRGRPADQRPGRAPSSSAFATSARARGLSGGRPGAFVQAGDRRRPPVAGACPREAAPRAREEVVGFDPRVGANAKAELPELRIATDPYDAVDGANAIVLATDWGEFRDLDLARLRNAAAAPVFVDARNAIDGRAVAGDGFAFVPVAKTAAPPGGLSRCPKRWSRAEPASSAPMYASACWPRAGACCAWTLLTRREDNLVGCASDSRFAFERTDVTRFVTVEGAVDSVVHLFTSRRRRRRAIISIIPSTFGVAALGTLNALGLAKASGAKFLLASKSEAYGDSLVNPSPSSTSTSTAPRGVYDEARRFAEAMTMAFHCVHAVPVSIARINTSGPRMWRDDGRAVPTFVSQELRGEPITVHGGGSQTRSAV